MYKLLEKYPHKHTQTHTPVKTADKARHFVCENGRILLPETLYKCIHTDVNMYTDSYR
jgi:hypothetical protein